MVTMIWPAAGSACTRVGTGGQVPLPHSVTAKVLPRSTHRALGWPGFLVVPGQTPGDADTAIDSGRPSPPHEANTPTVKAIVQNVVTTARPETGRRSVQTKAHLRRHTLETLVDGRELQRLSQLSRRDLEQHRHARPFVVAGGIQRLGASDGLFGALKRPV